MTSSTYNVSDEQRESCAAPNRASPLIRHSLSFRLPLLIRSCSIILLAYGWKALITFAMSLKIHANPPIPLLHEILS